MIARVWRGYASPENAHLYIEHVQHSVFPELEAIDGFRGANVLQKTENGEVEFVVTTFWDSMDAIHQFAGADAGVAVVAPNAQAVLSHYESTVSHYEVALTK
ncbi:MAG: antibiotic biosynthesis monooxygenase [Chloroflexota bacterium]